MVVRFNGYARDFQQAELIGLGHSAGPLLFGGAKNVSELNRFSIRLPAYGLLRRLQNCISIAHGALLARRYANSRKRMWILSWSKARIGRRLTVRRCFAIGNWYSSEFRPEKTFGDSKRGRAMVERFGEVVRIDSDELVSRTTPTLLQHLNSGYSRDFPTHRM